MGLGGRLPEEEPLEEAVALDAGEEEGLRGGAGARVGEHRQLPLDLLHLLRRHGNPPRCSGPLAAPAGSRLVVVLEGIEPTRGQANERDDVTIGAFLFF